MRLLWITNTILISVSLSAQKVRNNGICISGGVNMYGQNYFTDHDIRLLEKSSDESYFFDLNAQYSYGFTRSFLLGISLSYEYKPLEYKFNFPPRDDAFSPVDPVFDPHFISFGLFSEHRLIQTKSYFFGLQPLLQYHLTSYEVFLNHYYFSISLGLPNEFFIHKDFRKAFSIVINPSFSTYSTPAISRELGEHFQGFYYSFNINIGGRVYF